MTKCKKVRILVKELSLIDWATLERSTTILKPDKKLTKKESFNTLPLSDMSSFPVRLN